jgi:branched-chain amino acid transport system substrate-binding protein
MKRVLTALAAGTALVLSGCVAGNTSTPAEQGEPIVIGASIPLTGPFSGFGPLIQSGYEDAVAEVNDAGGIEIDGVLHPVTLVIQDNKSDSATAAEITRSLIVDEGAVALLGSVAPPLNVPASNIAEVEQIPLVTGLTPVRAWLGANDAGWNYAWNIFFIEDQMTQSQFITSDLTETNRKVALFTDQGEDGKIMGAMWEANAPEFGYEIVSHAEFPIGTTEFSSFINEAKAADAEIVITQMSPPDSFALWKQMKALGFVPKLAYCEKCGATSAFQKALGPVAEATLTTNYWNAGSHDDNEDAQRLLEAFGDTVGQNGDMSALVIAQSAASVLLDAIAAAGSTDPDAINAAIAATDAEYAIGPVKFTEDQYSLIESFHGQWRGDKMVPVDPKWPGAGDLVVPVTGLQ